MKNLIIGLIVMVSPFLSFGHNPLSARYHFEAGENTSLLTINLSQDGVNHLLSKIVSPEKLKTITSVELKELIVDYIKSNFNLSIDKEQIELKKGGIKLGSHQTDLKFVLPPFSKEAQKIDIHIPAFKENGNHQTIFSYTIKGKSDHLILRSSNDFQSTILLSAASNTNSWLWFILIGLVSLSSVFFLRRRFRNHNI